LKECLKVLSQINSIIISVTLTYSENRLRSKAFFFLSFFLSLLFLILFIVLLSFLHLLVQAVKPIPISNKPTCFMFYKVFLIFDMTSYNFLYEYHRFGKTCCFFIHKRKCF